MHTEGGSKEDVLGAAGQGVAGGLMAPLPLHTTCVIGAPFPVTLGLIEGTAGRHGMGVVG